MKGFRKYIPITLLVASLGLGFSVSCTEQESKETKLEQVVRRLEQVVSEEPKREELEESYERHVIGDKEYLFRDVEFRKHDDKSLTVYMDVKILDKEKQAKNLYVHYECHTNVKGEFDRDSLNLNNKDSNNSYIWVKSKKSSGSSMLEAEWVVIHYDNIFKTSENASKEEKEKYLEFGTKQLNLYNKLLNIEEKRKNSEGESLYHLLENFDISKLSAQDMHVKDRYAEGSLKADLDSVVITVFLDKNYPEHILLKSKKNSEETSSMFDHNNMNIYDYNADGNADLVGLNKTSFRMEKGQYEYIREFYTEEQVRNIFTNANQKLKQVNKLLEEMQAEEKKKDPEEILKEFE